MRDEKEGKKEAGKGRTNNKAKQYSTHHVWCSPIQTNPSYQRFLCCIDEGQRVETVQYSNCVQLHTCIYNVYTYMYMYAMMVVITVFMHMYKKLIHIHVLMRDERRKEERSKQDQTNNKAKQHSTPHVCL